MRHFVECWPRPTTVVVLCLILGAAGPLACMPASARKASPSEDATAAAAEAARKAEETTTAEDSDAADAEKVHQAFLEAGGTDASDAAVTAGLQWLIAHQASDGRWSLDHFAQDAKCSCTGGGRKDDVAATAFGILPFLARGESHRGGETGRYAKNLENALKFLISRQKSDGDLREPQSQMYTQGLATIALCEAFDMTADPMLREPCQKAVDFIVKAQYKDGGWRYQPFHAKGPLQQGDMSVSSWQLMALKAAQMSGMSVPKENLVRATDFLEAVALPNDDGYAYLPTKAGGTPAMTAAGMLCRQYLRLGGESFASEHMIRGSERLLKAPPAAQGRNFYYYYYATQVLFNIGGEPWQKWNPKLRDHLIKLQDQGKPGHEHQQGSWDPIGDGHNVTGGRMMTTSLALLTLEVYYRQFSLNRLEIPDSFKGPAEPSKKKPKK